MSELPKFPQWTDKEHPDFGYNINELIQYMLKTERVKREFVVQLESEIEENKDDSDSWCWGYVAAMMKVLEAFR